MVVNRLTAAGFIAILALSTTAGAQAPYVRSWVTKTEVVQDRPFWLFVEASGETVDTPEITQGDGIVINASSPQQSHSFTVGGGRQLQTFKLSYSTIAFRPGKATIPPVTVRINGRVLATDPIELIVLPTPAGTEPAPSPVRMWLSDSNVVVGNPFWIYIEATGSEISLPTTIQIDGIRIDPRNSQRSTSFSFGRQGQRTTEKHGFYATATRPGAIRIPPLDVRVSGRIVKTDAIEFVAKRSAVASVPSGTRQSASVELRQDDLVFIEMEVDQNSVYQGEPVLLTMQLWRIKYRRINSGPYRGGLIVNPTTEGFYVHVLDPGAFDATRGPWTYEITETRKLLYPTRTGDLQIGRWHWEGIALINRQSIIAREKLYYKLDAGPIYIKVQNLPQAPKGFTGGVGEFNVVASLDNNTVRQGVPVKLTVTIRGRGNPDAIGAPELPQLQWATSNRPDTTHRFYTDSSDGSLRMAKYFTYTLTPLRAGTASVPSFDFVYFDTVEKAYVRKPIGPFNVGVFESVEDTQRLVVPDDAAAIQRRVDILAEDIQPIAPLPHSIEVRRPAPAATSAAIAAPLLAYLGLSLFMVRRRRFATNRGFARAHHAKTKSLKRLRDVTRSPEPADALYRTLIAFVADIFDLEDSGMTSADVTRELDGREVDADLRDRTVRILKACERAAYAAQELSSEELNALIGGAETCVHDLKAIKRKGWK